MIFIRPFEKDDLTAFDPIEPIGQEHSPEMLQAIENSGLAVTGLRDGRVIGCGGTHPVNEAQGEIWLRLSKDCLNHKLDTLRWIREGLKIIEETYPFNQLNAVIKCSFDKGVKLARFLGFCKTQEITRENQKWAVYSKRVKE